MADDIPQNVVPPQPEPEPISSDQELSEFSEGEDDDMGDEIEGLDMGFDLGALLSTDDGDTVCSALLDINGALGEVARQMATTNKILIKMLAKLS